MKIVMDATQSLDYSSDDNLLENLRIARLETLKHEIPVSFSFQEYTYTVEAMK